MVKLILSVWWQSSGAEDANSYGKISIEEETVANGQPGEVLQRNFIIALGYGW